MGRQRDDKKSQTLKELYEFQMMKDNAETCSFVCRPAVKMEQHSRDEISCIKRLRRCTTGSKRLVTTSTAILLLSGRAASKLEYSVEEKTGLRSFTCFHLC